MKIKTSELDWKNAGTPEDHAKRLDGLAHGEKPTWGGSTMHYAAQCIRYLDARVEMLEKDNAALRRLIATYERDRTYCASECATRQCPRHQSNVPSDTGGVPVPVAWGHFRATCPDYRRPTKCRTRSA